MRVREYQMGLATALGYLGGRYVTRLDGMQEPST